MKIDEALEIVLGELTKNAYYVLMPSTVPCTVPVLLPSKKTYAFSDGNEALSVFTFLCSVS